MEVFIVRPFGNRVVLRKDKSTGDLQQVMCDFDKVEAELIAPALRELGLSGGTTGEIWGAGSIHKDMFSFLLTADIIIADITIHNANVFYELGIRHALRNKKTILIKCPGYDDTPFDIAGYRYLSYDIAKPATILNKLVQVISETIKKNNTDSPVYDTLPQLRPQDAEKFILLPDDFVQEVRLAEGSRQPGKLSLLAKEAENFFWRKAAWRLIGEALYRMKSMDAARAVWEKITVFEKEDMQANDRLATIYQRLAEKEMVQNPDEAAVLLTRSDLAIEKLLAKDVNTDQEKRAEARALKARNIKTRWINNWKNENNANKPLKALQSVNLQLAYKQYELAFFECLNHYYSGINALGLLITLIELAEKYPQEWELAFKRKTEAEAELDMYRERRVILAGAVQVSLEAAVRKQERSGNTDTWLKISEADLSCLIENNPARVAANYNKALEGSEAFYHEAARRQLYLYEQLQVLKNNVTAALSVLCADEVKSPGTQYVLFTGHMIDKPGREAPRFPPEKEAAVRQKIRAILEAEQISTTEELKGITGGACGGDILFHEVCGELGIKTEMYLALPRDLFIQESVQFAGPEWVTRFDNLYKKLPHRILSQTKELPQWLQKKEGYGFWERNNLWELYGSLLNGGINLTLVALWDGKGGDGPGGTAHMVKEAQRLGAKVRIIDIKGL